MKLNQNLMESLWIRFESNLEFCHSYTGLIIDTVAFSKQIHSHKVKRKQKPNNMSLFTKMNPIINLKCFKLLAFMLLYSRRMPNYDLSYYDRPLQVQEWLWYCCSIWEKTSVVCTWPDIMHSMADIYVLQWCGDFIPFNREQELHSTELCECIKENETFGKDL